MTTTRKHIKTTLLLGLLEEEVEETHGRTNKEKVQSHVNSGGYFQKGTDQDIGKEVILLGVVEDIRMS